MTFAEVANSFIFDNLTIFRRFLITPVEHIIEIASWKQFSQHGKYYITSHRACIFFFSFFHLAFNHVYFLRFKFSSELCINLDCLHFLIFCFYCCGSPSATSYTFLKKFWWLNLHVLWFDFSLNKSELITTWRNQN